MGDVGAGVFVSLVGVLMLLWRFWCHKLGCAPPGFLGLRTPCINGRSSSWYSTATRGADVVYMCRRVVCILRRRPITDVALRFMELIITVQQARSIREWTDGRYRSTRPPSERSDERSETFPSIPCTRRYHDFCTKSDHTSNYDFIVEVESALNYSTHVA